MSSIPHAFKIGEKIPDALSASMRQRMGGAKDGGFFEYKKDAVRTFYILYNKPTFEETEMLQDSSLKIHLSDIEGVLWLCLTSEGRPFMDCPYHPGLYKPEDRPEPSSKDFANDESLRDSFLIAGVDSNDFTFFALRFFSLSNRFSKQMALLVEKKLKAEIDPTLYAIAVNKVLSTHTSAQIVKKSLMYSRAGE